MGSQFSVRKGHHLLDTVDPQSKHQKPFYSEGITSSRRHAFFERRQEAPIERIHGAAGATAFGPLALEPASLFPDVGELGESVAYLDPGQVKLEPFRGSGLTGARPSQRGLALRVVRQEHRTPASCERWFDSGHQELEVA
jgi:hypothetical protein